MEHAPFISKDNVHAAEIGEIATKVLECTDWDEHKQLWTRMMALGATGEQLAFYQYVLTTLPRTHPARVRAKSYCVALNMVRLCENDDPRNPFITGVRADHTKRMEYCAYENMWSAQHRFGITFRQLAADDWCVWEPADLVAP